MPHLFANRPRLHDIVKQTPDLRDQFRWETINAVVCEVGGVIFVVGSILFFPSTRIPQVVGDLRDPRALQITYIPMR